MTLSNPASSTVGVVRTTISPRVRSAAPSVLLLALAIANGFAMRGILGPVQDAAKADLHLSDFQMSLVQGLAASIPIALLSLPLGRAVDRANRVRLLIALSAVSTFGTLLTPFASGFWLLFLARMLAGLGAVCALPAAISIMADLSPPERRGRMLLALSLGQYVGTAAAFALGGAAYGALGHMAHPLAGLAPWRGVHLVFGLVSAALLAPLFLLKEPMRREFGEAADAALGPALRELWSRRAFLGPLFVGQIGVVMADTAAAIWAAPVLVRDHHLRPDQFAVWMGLVVLLAGVLGSVAGGLAADAGQRSHKRGGILIGAAIASALALPAALFSAVPGVPAFAVLLGLLLASGAAAGLVTASALAVLIPNELRGVCLGAFVVLGGIVGFGVAPTLVTLVSSAMGRLGLALAVTNGVIGLMSFLAFCLAARNAPRSTAGPMVVRADV